MVIVMLRPIPSIMFGIGMYLEANVAATGLIISEGIMFPTKASRRLCGLADVMGFDASKFGFGCELNGLYMFTPASLKSPRASASVGTVSTIVIALTCRRPS